MEIIRNLTRRKLRNTLTISGIVIGVLALMIACGADLHAAMRVANHAAGIVVGKLGTHDNPREGALLMEHKQRAEAEKYSAQRRGQIGTGGREEKIRTYNFPQNRVTDHRIGLTLYNLDRVMEGDLGELIQSLQTADVAERLKQSAAAA